MALKNPSSRHLRRTKVTGTLVLLFVGLFSSIAFTQQWHEFEANAPAKASQVNENFDIVAPPGIVLAYAGNTAPNGWLMCDGTSYNTADYPALAAVLGAGGDSFSVPDLTTRFIRGKDAAGYALQEGGAETITQVPRHTHEISASGAHTHSFRASNRSGVHVSNGSDGFTRGSSDFDDISFRVPHREIEPDGDGDHEHAVQSTGEASVSILPPYLTMSYIIKI